MKYLKMFESEEETLFKIIDIPERDNKIGTSEMDKLSKNDFIVFDEVFDTFDIGRCQVEKKEKIFSVRLPAFETNKKSTTSISVVKTTDDYYYLTFKKIGSYGFSTCYECDTIEGLSEALDQVLSKGYYKRDGFDPIKQQVIDLLQNVTSKDISISKLLEIKDILEKKR